MRSSSHALYSALGLLALLVLSGCTAIPADALRLPPESDRNRELQTRHFAALAEPDLLAAGAGVIQDLGFTLEESESKLGLITASRRLTSRRPLKETEVIAAVALTAVAPWWGGPTLAYRAVAGIKEPQIVRLSLVTTPAPPGQGASLRVTAQRVVYVDENSLQVKEVERLNDPAFFQEFFNRLEKSAFLEKEQNAR